MSKKLPATKIISFTKKIAPRIERQILSFPLISNTDNGAELLRDKYYAAVAISTIIEKEEVIGYILIRPPIDDLPVLLQYVEVSPAYQRKGVGSLLVKKALIFLKRKGEKCISLRSLSGNENFFKRFGFYKMGQLMKLTI